MSDRTNDVTTQRLKSASSSVNIVLRGVKRFISILTIFHVFAFWGFFWFVIAKSHQIQGETLATIFTGVVFIGGAVLLLVGYLTRLLDINIVSLS